MQRVHYTKQDAVGIIALDDGKANVIQQAFLDQLAAVLDQIEADDSVRAVVLRGRPKFFSAGLDIKTLPTLESGALTTCMETFGDVMLRLIGFPKPLIGAVTGHALAGGAVMLLSCDHRIGSNGSNKIGLNEVSVGLPVPTFILDLAQMVLQPSSWTESVCFGRIYSPDQAQTIGYLQELVDTPEQVLDLAIERASQLGKIDAKAFAVTKRRMRADITTRGQLTAHAELGAFLDLPLFARD
jgi:enoyl-CoA hydratase